NHIIETLRAMSRATIGIVRPQRAINVRRGRKGNPWSVGSAAFFTSLIAGDAQSAPAPPVKTGMKGNELVLAAIKPCQLQCPFNGFRAAIAEECLREAGWRNLRDLFGEISDWLHMVQVGCAVYELLHLRLCGCDHPSVIMTGVDHRNSGKAVKILTAG